MPKISVILPVYNVEQFLESCLNSVVAQTLSDIEIICINDGSTDNSPEILNKYAAKDSRIIVVNQENQGQGVARNKGVEIAKGEYIQFIDPDDWVELDMLEKLYNFANSNNSQVVKFNYREYNNYSGKYKNINFADKIKKEYNYNLFKTPYYNWKSLKKDCLSNLNPHVWSYFYSTEFIKSNQIEFSPTRCAEDHLFACGALLLAERIDYLDEYFYTYRIRSGSSVHIKSNQNMCIFDNIAGLKSFLMHNNLYEELKGEWINYARVVVSWHYNQIPDENKNEYENLSMQYFDSKEEFNTFKKRVIRRNNFLEEIFSIKNEYKDAIKYKEITILGAKIHIKPKKMLIGRNL